MSLYLLNKLENPILSINDIERVNKILEINKLRDQLSKEFNKIKQFIKGFNIDYHDILK